MTSKIRIYHNPRCSKSRQALQMLEDQGMKVEVIEYLKTPLNFEEIEELLSMLKLDPRELMRSSESEYKDNNLSDEKFTKKQLIQAMVKYPKLIQRPIVVKGKKAAIGRPLENIMEIL